MTTAAYAAIEYCRGCHAPLRQALELLQMEPMPLAGHFPATPQEARHAPCYPYTLLQCTACSLVQVQEDVSDALLYQRYNYASSSIPGLVRHFTEYAAWLAARLPKEQPRVLEIGCNDGVLLRQLPASWQRVGVDPSDVAAHALERNYELVSQPFSDALAKELAGSGPFDLVTGSNCLAHIADLRDVFIGVQRVLADGGLFVLEVHDLAATAELGQWDTLYHEHKVEWSLGALANCLLPLGFRFVESSLHPLHGGLLRACFAKGGKEPAPGPASTPELGNLKHAYTARRSSRTYERIARALQQGKCVAAYGAAGRANVWFNQHPELAFDFVVDDAPLRASRFIPRLAFPILPSKVLEQRCPDVCVITAWNYASDIRAKHRALATQWEQSLGGD